MIRALILFALTTVALDVIAQKGFSLAEDKAGKKIRVMYNNKMVTAYSWTDSTEKPVLFPVRTLSGITVTRGYPIAPRVGERTDHPHHVGIWLNYESVNGLDFWNNSDAIAAEKKSHYGSIKHQKVLASKSTGSRANIKASSHWVDSKGTVLLDETTDFVFSVRGNDLIIDRTSTLEAKVPEVVFKDVKDGMLAIRVARQLEMPSKEKGSFVDMHGKVTQVEALDNAGVSGMYVTKEGVKGDSVWSKRSTWCVLNGNIGGKDVSIVILDNPKNPGYPTYWHARGYGLFAANPLGQKVFSKGKEEMNLTLKQGEKVTFQYRIIIHEGSHMTAAEIERECCP